MGSRTGIGSGGGGGGQAYPGPMVRCRVCELRRSGLIVDGGICAYLLLRTGSGICYRCRAVAEAFGCELLLEPSMRAVAEAFDASCC